MSTAGMVLDVVLISLLVAALAYGFRLERRLKVLREGQVGFALAVNELNGAATRAESAVGQRSVAHLHAAVQRGRVVHLTRVDQRRADTARLAGGRARARARPRRAGGGVQ